MRSAFGLRQPEDSMLKQTTTLLIGLGNENRGDDAVGLLIASHLKTGEGAGLQVLRHMGETVGLIDDWRGADSLIIVDAAMSGCEAGTIHRIDASAQSMPGDLVLFSTHDFSVAQAIELARALGQLPPRVIVYGIEGKNFDAGNSLTPAVERAAREVEALVLKDIEAVDQLVRT